MHVFAWPGKWCTHCAPANTAFILLEAFKEFEQILAHLQAAKIPVSQRSANSNR